MAYFHRSRIPLIASFGAATALTSLSYNKQGDVNKGKKYSGKTIVITGAGGTFGAMGVQHFGSLGANVVLMDLNSSTLNATMDKLVDIPSNQLSCCVCDVRDYKAVEKALNEAIKPFNNKVDMLWNNAGVQGEMKPLLEYNPNDVDFVMGVNVVGTFNVLQIVGKNMSNNGGGTIVQTGSVAALRGTPTMCAYVASKAAIHGLTMTAAKDLAPYNIRVNTILPALIGPSNGYMWARQNELHAKSNSPYFNHNKDIVAKNKINSVPMKRLGEVSEVIQAVDYLLSQDSSYITGTSLVIAGGMA
mmetsp:Transcript_14383/g.17100  ORF Transcript_14383/g.17100 Transcript_14383/m.17100 type:complete len:302 (+) Transcript_14383:21-926(+)